MLHRRLLFFVLSQIIQSCLTNQLYAIDLTAETNFTATFFKPGDKIFDVGAHEGKMTELYLACGAAKVICIEPQPTCLDVLRKKFHNDDRVIIIGKGLDSISGKKNIHICSVMNCISTFSEDWIYHSRFSGKPSIWNQTIEIEMTTLDELIKSFGTPQFCKIDVENFEYEVLAGLFQPIPLLSFEFHAEFMEKVQKCLDKLTVLGYKKFNFAIGAIYKYALKDWVSASELLTQIKSGLFIADGGQLWGDIYAQYHPEDEDVLSLSDNNL